MQLNSGVRERYRIGVKLDVEKFRSALASIGEEALSGKSKPPALRLYPNHGPEDAKGISVYYSPFEHVNDKAEAVFVGITPGEAQMRRAWVAAKQALSRGQSIDSAIWEVKRVSSFNDESGQMRRNLYRQAEHWHVHTWLGLSSGAELFESGWSKIQTTSVIQFPTFLRGGNYKGQSPAPLRHDFLAELVRSRLVAELNEVPDAVVFSFGPKVASVLCELKDDGLIPNPLFTGMFHPSGENTYRFDYLCGDRRGPPPHRTNPEAYDAGQAAFIREYVPGAL